MLLREGQDLTNHDCIDCGSLADIQPVLMHLCTNRVAKKTFLCTEKHHETSRRFFAGYSI